MNQEAIDQHDKTQAEIAKLLAETFKINAENRAGKVESEVAKTLAETKKLNTENQWYLVFVTATATLALVAIVKLFI